MSSLSGGKIPAGLIVDASTLLAQTQTSVQAVGSSNATDFLKTSASSSQASQTSDGRLQQVPAQQSSDAQQRLQTFWQKQMEEVQTMSTNEFKTQELPLARIKKIMKMDDDVKMISAEAPLLFSKAAQIFITELSLRAWIHTEDSKRRTLQRNDIATAITKFDQFDFLIDIVPREELKAPKTNFVTGGSSDQMQYFYTLPQQSRGTVSVNNTMASLGQGTVPVSALQSGQILLAQQSQNGQPLTLTPINVENNQVLQLAQPSTQSQPSQQPASTILLSAQTAENENQNAQKEQTIVGSLNSEQHKQQTAQAILQQLVSNLPNSSPGEVHSIQINSQGQLQLVKVSNPQTQNTVVDDSRQVTQQLMTGNDNSEMYELAAGITGTVRNSDGVITADTNHGIDAIYVQQQDN